MKSQHHKLSGIDLFRGIAAYAVIVLHSGDRSSGIPVTSAATNLQSICYFAVPFFIATSFYFTLAKQPIDTSLASWRKRCERVLIPYATWSVIYLIFRTIFFHQSHQIERLWHLVSDPLAIVFLGGASYQLYYLPLIFTGSFLIFLAKYLRQIGTSRTIIAALLVISSIVYQWLFVSGNAFQLNPNLAFNSFSQTSGWDVNSLPPLRLALVQIAWLLNCLPYLLIGIWLLPTYDRVAKWQHRTQSLVVCGCVLMFCLTSVAIFMGIPIILKDIIQSYCLLTSALIISTRLKSNWAISSVGNCSFGIYLIHPFAMLIVKKIVDVILPNLSKEVSIASLLTISFLTFILSWMLIALMRKNRWISRYALGERLEYRRSTEID